MGEQLLRSLLEQGEGMSDQLSIISTIILFSHSLLLGSVLSIITYLSATPLLKNKNNQKAKELETSLNNDEGSNLSAKAKIILGSSNILFLCVGLTGVMILVNNNLARALSIGATMALIRFRVKLGPKNLGSNLLFGIIVGVACGLQKVEIAWIVTIIYILLQGVLYFILRKIK